MAYLSSTPDASTWLVNPITTIRILVSGEQNLSNGIFFNENSEIQNVSINRSHRYDIFITTPTSNKYLFKSHLNINEVPVELSFTLFYTDPILSGIANNGIFNFPSYQSEIANPKLFWISNKYLTENNNWKTSVTSENIDSFYMTSFAPTTIKIRHIIYPGEDVYFGPILMGPSVEARIIITDLDVTRPSPNPLYFPVRISKANEKIIEYNDARAENWLASQQINGRINNAQIDTINFLIDPATNADLLAINENYVTYDTLSGTTLTSYIQYLSDVKNTTNFVNDGFGNAYNFFNENSTVYFNLANDFNANLSDNMNEINLLSTTIANIEVSNIADTNFTITNSDIINLQVSINDELLTTICNVSNAITIKELLNINSLNSLMSNTNNSINSTNNNIVIVNNFASNIITIGVSAKTQVDSTAPILNTRRTEQNAINDTVYLYHSNLGSFPNTVKYGLPYLISSSYNTFNSQSTTKTENVDEVYTIVNDLVNAINENKNIANTLPEFVKNNINDIITSIGSTDQRIAETIYHFNRFN